LVIPVSLGEIADKIAVLDVKSRKIKNEEALENVLYEKKELEKICNENGIDFGALLEDLISINEKIWDTLQKQRDIVSSGDTGKEFVDVSISVYEMNDIRFSIKQEINKKWDSDIIEEKHYE
jgi:hypothetical protein